MPYGGTKFLSFFKKTQKNFFMKIKTFLRKIFACGPSPLLIIACIQLRKQCGQMRSFKKKILNLSPSVDAIMAIDVTKADWSGAAL